MLTPIIYEVQQRRGTRLGIGRSKFGGVNCVLELFGEENDVYNVCIVYSVYNVCNVYIVYMVEIVYEVYVVCIVYIVHKGCTMCS